MYVPATVPIQAGDAIGLPALTCPKPLDLGQAPLPATVVRVDRRALLTMGYVAVGVRFERT
jgi:hypothetical protein